MAERADEVLAMVDDLSRLVDEAGSVPLTTQVRLDREHVYDLCDRLRALLPEETRQARWLVKERDELFRAAQRECSAIVAEARERAEAILSREQIDSEARKEAESIVQEAREGERRSTLLAEDDADEVLDELESNLARALASVRKRPGSATEPEE